MKTLKIFLISILILLSIMFSACSLPFNSSCVGKGASGNSKTTQESWTGFAGNYTFEIIEKNSWYYPTITGQIKTDILPDALYVTCNNETTKIEIDNTRKINGYYLLDFEQEIIYGVLTQGNHKAVITGKFGTKTRTIKQTSNLVADDLYTAVAVLNDFCWDDDTGEPCEIIYAMDKESNWIGPF